MVELHGRIVPEGKLSGEISSKAALSGQLAKRQALRGQLNPSEVLRGAIAAPVLLSGTLSIATGTVPSYHGQTEIVPCEFEQVIDCAGLVMPANFIVDAIPSNYGKIGWNGLTLSVS